MKKIFLILLASAMVFSCSKESLNKESRKKLVFDIQVSQGGNSAVGSAPTKALKTGFEEGDKVYIFFEDVLPTKHLTLTRQAGGSWTYEPEGELDVEDLTASGKNMHAIFFPFEQPVIQNDGTGVSFKTNSGLFIYTYNMVGKGLYTVEEDGDSFVVSGELTVSSSDDYVQFFIDREDENYAQDKQYRLSVEGIKPVTCTGFYDNGFTYKELAAGQPLWGYMYLDEGVSFTGVVDNSWSDASKSHTAYLFNIKAAAKKKVFTGKTLAAGKAIRLTNVDSWDAAVQTPETVDLGCETCFWGTFNLGATDVLGKGMYFSWGNIVPSTDGTEEYYSKTLGYEVFGNRKVSLKDEYAIYDAATAFLGPGWRMMTKVFSYNNGELDFLYNLPHSWDTGKKAMVFTGNEQSITLPAAGNYNQDGLIAENVYGWYRSSEAYPGVEYKSYTLMISSSQYERYTALYNYCQSIRPVKDK